MVTRAGRILLLVFTLCLAAFAAAQSKVRWSAELPQGKAGETAIVKLTAKIDKTWHLYSLTKTSGDGPLNTEITPQAPLAAAGPSKQPKPVKKLDPNFGVQVEYFEDSVTFEVPVKLGPDPTKGAIQVRYQVCNPTMCMPPKTEVVPLGASTPPAATTAPTKPAGDAYANDFHKAQNGGLLTFAEFAFVAGLLSLLTPCVFPMIPITVSYFTKRREKHGDSLAPVVAYCVGIIGSFAGFGLIVTLLFGASGVQRFATNPAVNLVLAAVFVVLALSLFGRLNLTLPASITNRFTGPQERVGLLGPVLMGLTFTLTSFTCTVPAVGTILAGAAQGNLLYPLVGMLAYGAAFALPFFLLAIFPQFLAKLPKSGAWLETVKGFMGFLELAAALKFFSNADLVWQTGVLSRPVFLVIWAVLAGLAALYLFGRIPFIHGSTGKIGRGRLVFATLSAISAVWLASGVTGRSLGEVEAFLPPSETSGAWIKTYERGLQVARQTDKPILVNFTGVTCTNCRWMEKNMFTRPDVVKEFDNYVLVELYTDQNTDADRQNQALQEKITGVTTLPIYVSLSPSGERLKVFEGSTRSPQEFISFLRSGKGTGLRASR